MLLVEQNAGIALELADHAYLIETGCIVMGGPASHHRLRRRRAPRLSRLLKDKKCKPSCTNCCPAWPMAASMRAWRSRW